MTSAPQPGPPAPLHGPPNPGSYTSGVAQRPRPADPLASFRPATAAWFRAAFAAPTPAQTLGWPAISAGEHTLICAPTGSGKTLAAFLWCLDRLFADPPPADPLRRLRVLYVSPLKALVHDVDRNLRVPLAGIALAAAARGEEPPAVRVAMRTGDTPASDRRAFGKRPPDILVTTPESLYLLLTSSAREALRSVEWVIVDEIHAVAGTKRGAHLALSLERLAALADRPPQRIGLSATQRPLSAIAAFLGGRDDRTADRPPARRASVTPVAPGTDEFPLRPVTIVDVGVRKPLELEVVVPVEDMSRLGELIPLDEAPGGPAAGPAERVSIWPSVYPRILELIRAHRSTIVFVNSRRLAERLAQRLNELAGEELVRAHHGSLAREQRVQIEDQLKAGRLPAIVATSSLELGIDMGAVDLVIQVESPGSVARGLQRIGRAGHAVDEPSRGVIFPKYRGDLLECAVVTRAMRDGAIESTEIPRNPLDVLAQQIVATCAERPWPVDELFRMVRRAENYAGLGWDAFEAVLGMLAGQYPSDEFAELRPRIVWDRAAGTARARDDARRVAVQSGGTIPDRGLFGVYLDEGGSGDGREGSAGLDGAAAAAVRGARTGRTGGRRVGELDEEMVYETRPGEVILLGASAWRVERITHDRVLVRPAPGEPGKVPFWKGEGPGRPFEFGRAIGAFTRELTDDLHRGRSGRAAAIERLTTRHDLDALAAENLLAYLEEEEEAAGAVASDRTVVIERFRDELGDWRVCVLTPFGGRVHAPWALAIEARLRDRLGLEVQPLWSDDGIVFRLPATEGEGDGRDDFSAIEAAILPDPDEVEDLVVGAVGGSALFAARFRENAARALLLPRARGGQRRPLWQMRQRSSQLLAVASRYGSFPIVLETYRECLQDVFDVPALRELLAAVRRRDVRVHAVETRRASPFAASLLFSYIAVYMYEGDAPLVDRRAQALALDRELLRELLGAEELRDLIDPGALADLELELQALTPERAAASADGVHDLLRRLGDLSAADVAARVRGAGEDERTAAAGRWLAALAGERRAVPYGSPARSGGSPPRTRGGSARRSGRRPHPGFRRRSSRRGPIRLAACSLAGPGRTARSCPMRPRPAGRSPGGRSSRRWSASCRQGPSSAASSVRAASSASGAIRRSCARSAVARWRGCAGRWNRSSPPPTHGSFPPGRGWRAPARPVQARPPAVHRHLQRPRPRPSDLPQRSIGWRRSSPSWKGFPCRRACWNAMFSRYGCRGTVPVSLTSWARPARSAGWAADASAATTAGSRCTGPTGWPSSSTPPGTRIPPAACLPRATTGSARRSPRISVRAAPPSTVTCTPPRSPRPGIAASARRPSGSSSTPSGTLPGTDSSQTTPLPRCARSDGVARVPMRVPGASAWSRLRPADAGRWWPTLVPRPRPSRGPRPV